MAERSKAHAWKVCIRQRIEGSNPSLSANFGSLLKEDIAGVTISFYTMQRVLLHDGELFTYLSFEENKN